MENKHLAVIDFIQKSQGGRISPPPSCITSKGSCPYSPIIRFNDDPSNSWSINVEFYEKSSSHPNLSYYHLSFISPDAPDSKPINHAEFSLYEGKKLVAHGLILKI
jgi:hypothetical protein